MVSEKLPLISVCVALTIRFDLSISTTFAIITGPSFLLHTCPEIRFCCAKATLAQMKSARVRIYLIFFMACCYFCVPYLARNAFAFLADFHAPSQRPSLRGSKCRAWSNWCTTT